MKGIELAFHERMIAIYDRARRECNYTATRFHQMVVARGGFATARDLLATNDPSDGFITLWEHRRLDLTVEHLVLEPEFESLFGDDERAIARARLDAVR